MTKDELFEIFDKYDTYEFRKEGESIHGIKWADLNGLADELVKLFAIPVVVKSLPQDNFCIVCNLPTDGEKCYSKRCPV
jgi:hypothetical protein